MKKLSVRRRHPLAAVVVLLLALAATGGLYAAFAPAGKAQADETSQSLTITEGKKLYEVGCASCHGTGGQGSSDGPSLVGVGAAAVDFQVGTGRMPAATMQGAQVPGLLGTVAGASQVAVEHRRGKLLCEDRAHSGRAHPVLLVLRVIGGEDPVAFIRRYANRIPYFHIKDGQWEPGHPGKATRFTELGAGSVDLRSAIGAALQVNPEWLVYEQDTSNDRDPVESATESLRCLRQLAGQG